MTKDTLKENSWTYLSNDIRVVNCDYSKCRYDLSVRSSKIKCGGTAYTDDKLIKG